MNLEQLLLEARQTLRDPTIESSLTTWFNDEMLQLSMQFELPALKLKRPATLVTINTEWQYSMTTDVSHESGYIYQKKVWRCTNPSNSDASIPIGRTIEALDRLDPDHSETATDITRIAVEDDAIAVYPMANDSLNLWFYRKPVAMANDTDVPDGLAEEFHYRVLIPRVVLRAFRVYPELTTEVAGDATRSITWWTNRLEEGLYGSRTQIGLLDALRKNNLPKLRGARPGKNLAGGDYWEGSAGRGRW